MTSRTSDHTTIAALCNHSGISAFGNVYQFTGRRLDDATGLYYYRNRYYEPTSGRFISRDPLGYVSGPTLYAYTANNPIAANDPMGLDFQYLGWKWGKPIGKVEGRTYAYYRVRLACVCKGGYWYIKFIDADVRLRIILNRKFKPRYQSIQNGTLTDQSGAVVGKTALTFVDKKGNTVPTSYGIFGHEMLHVNSVQQAYNSALAPGGKLRSAIEQMENIAQGNHSAQKCTDQIGETGYWRLQLMDLLKKVIDEAAGHDTVSTTPQPEGGKPYTPPAGVMLRPTKKWPKLTKYKRKYTQYPLPEKW